MSPNDQSYKALKVLIHLLSLVPFAYVVTAIVTQSRSLGADPQEAVLHLMGFWSLIFLLLTLTLTPINRVFKIPVIIRFRRAIGLYSAFYLFLHIIIFFIFYLEMDLNQLMDETIKRPYISVGMIASILMLMLSVTSTKRIQRAMGKNWKRLHQSIYLIAILAVAHFIWQSKSDLNEPLWYLIFLIFLLSFRFKNFFKSPIKSHK